MSAGSRANLKYSFKFPGNKGVWSLCPTAYEQLRLRTPLILNGQRHHNSRVLEPAARRARVVGLHQGTRRCGRSQEKTPDPFSGPQSFVRWASESQPGCTLGERGGKDRLSLACFWNSSRATGRTAPAPLRGESQRGELGEKSSDNPHLVIPSALSPASQCAQRRITHLPPKGSD